ncbi:MAG: glycosyltransferase family 4 protein [Planctomycetes bacterium]|nr:glycosyltransferase family 4 protein [Planctomycetota bacterium]
MKIAWVIEQMNTSNGGKETSTAQVVGALADAGHEVVILCQKGSWSHPGVTVNQLGVRGPTRRAQAANFASDVVSAVNAGGFDIVHTVTPVNGANVYQLRSGSIPGQIEAGSRRWGRLGFVRKMLAPLSLRRALLGRIEKQMAAQPGVKFLPVSRMVAQELAQHYGLGSQVCVVYNAVSGPSVSPDQRAKWRRELRARIGASDDAVVFVTAANNMLLKGVPQTLRHFARWRDESARKAPARLVVIGDESARRMGRLAARLGVKDEVVFVPHVDDVFPWYSAADACILLSWYDPCSRVVLEALRWGLPSITTVYNGAAEALARGGGIVVSSPEDARAVVAAMAELADPSHRRRRIEACESCVEEISIEHHVARLLEVYESLVRRRIQQM